MQQANSVSSVLPVSPATPVQGSSANGAAASGNDGQNTFSQVLRDKQTANAEATKTNAPSDGKTEPTSQQGKTDASEPPDQAQKSTGTAETDAPARSAAELAQLLAAAGLMAGAQTAQAPVVDDKTAALIEDTAATDPLTKLAADPSTLTALPQTDKTAAAATNLAASLAANTANTTAPDQTLTTQSALTSPDSKPGQSGRPGGDQQGTDKRGLLQVAATTEGDKLRADAGTTETSFSAALDRASNGVAVATTTTQTQASAPASHTVTTPVGRQGWADEVGQRVLWTAKSDNSRADLVLTPPQLGRIEVSIQMNGDQASASFMVANPVAREALQDAMPRLREMLAQAGIQLGQADVSTGQSGQSNAQGERRHAGGGNGTGMLGADGAIGTASNGWARQGSGLVDTFA